MDTKANFLYCRVSDTIHSLAKQLAKLDKRSLTGYMSTMILNAAQVKNLITTEDIQKELLR